jgi:hypothetical protein
VDLIMDPPYFFEGGIAADRSFLYCSLFDNGSTDTSPKVKHKSTAHASPLGKACTVPRLPPDNRPYRACLEGPFRSDECVDNADCDSFPGAGDGECDEVCTLVGGFTTTDEMFILIGSYYIDDTPLDEPPAPPPPPAVVAPSSFCGLIGLELIWLWPLARWLRGHRRV